MIGILTYDIPHRKTYDTLCLLKAKGYSEVKVFFKSLHYKKKFKPLIEHRPKNMNDIHPSILCENFGYEYIDASMLTQELPGGSVILVCGAGIIEEEIINGYKVVNAHPGYIPNVRGLDALKWAIMEDEYIGVSVHLIGDEVDCGKLLDRRVVPVQHNDTFHALAQRQYEMEIVMLVEAIDKVSRSTMVVHSGDYILHKRMSIEIESKLLDKFEEFKNRPNK